MNAQSPVVIVGAGPIGIETAVALRQAGVRSTIVEAGAIGHTISWWSPQTRWFSSNDRIAIAGVPLLTVDQSKASREEYLTYLQTVVAMHQLDVRTFSKVQRIECTTDSLTDGGRFRLLVSRGDRQLAPAPRAPANVSSNSSSVDGVDTLDASSIVLAIGGTDFPNALGVPGEDLPHVDGYLREIHRYHGRRVVVIGGRNSAVEGAIRLHRGGARVSLVYHGESLPSESIKYWLRPEIESLIASGAITAHFGVRVQQITPMVVRCHSVLSGVRALDLEADDVLPLIGYRQDTTLLDQLGIERDPISGRPRFDPETMQTSRTGIYLAGTAIAGTQSSHYRVFLENCHDHAEKIARDVSGSMHLSDIRPHVVGQATPTGQLRSRIAMQPES